MKWCGFVLRPIEVYPDLCFDNDDMKCPKCGNRLYFGRHGYICRNWKCPVYHRFTGIFFASDVKKVYR